MLISLGGVTGGLCARSCVNGATKNSTKAAQICRILHNLTSQHALNDDFARISPFFWEATAETIMKTLAGIPRVSPWHSLSRESVSTVGSPPYGWNSSG